MKIMNGSDFPGMPKRPGGKPERIKIDARCPVCGTLYDFGKLEVLLEEDGATLMYIKCSVCDSAALSIIALGSFGLKVATALTDLEQDEVLRFRDEAAVKSEDVLTLHEAMEKTDNFLQNIH
ncbi:MAG: hypothetical protein PHY34_01920 [Patescibacteria group bacterium]|nr:hypothetical protein [Patescibacteria group bacterium]MDD5715308.1 hypothetical protein [Patescibacteria group bacterium]